MDAVAIKAACACGKCKSCLKQQKINDAFAARRANPEEYKDRGRGPRVKVKIALKREDALSRTGSAH